MMMVAGAIKLREPDRLPRLVLLNESHMTEIEQLCGGHRPRRYYSRSLKGLWFGSENVEIEVLAHLLETGDKGKWWIIPKRKGVRNVAKNGKKKARTLRQALGAEGRKKTMQKPGSRKVSTNGLKTVGFLYDGKAKAKTAGWDGKTARVVVAKRKDGADVKLGNKTIGTMTALRAKRVALCGMVVKCTLKEFPKTIRLVLPANAPGPAFTV